MKKEKVKLCPPWINYMKQFEALFGQDPDIRLEINEELLDIRMFVSNTDKADALTRLLPTEKDFGAMTVAIDVIPANRNTDDQIEMFEKALAGNPALSYIKELHTDMGFDAAYVVFKKEVVQYYADNLGDVNGNRSTLYENIARDIFQDTEGIFFCTGGDVDG